LSTVDSGPLLPSAQALTESTASPLCDTPLSPVLSAFGPLVPESAAVGASGGASRRAAGIAAARAAGKRWGGRRPGSFKVAPERIRQLADKGLRRAEIAKALGVSTRTVARMLAVVSDA
jgi:hypothetical protein